MNPILRRGIHTALMLEHKDDGGGAGPSPADIKTMEDLKGEFLKHHKSLREFIEKANNEIKLAGDASTETRNAIKSLTDTLNGLGTRMDKIEAKGNREGETQAGESLGLKFIKSDAYGAIKTGKLSKARMEVEGFDIKAIINASGQNQPLVPDMRIPGVQTTPNRRLRIRELIPTGRTTSNLVQFVREDVFTNNAGPQVGGSPTVAGENQTKNESNITFTLQNAAVATLAHFILVSTQVLDDAPMLESYINGRLLYGLALEEEDEILNGDGTVGTLNGLMNQATAYNRATTGTKMDWIRRAITQLQLSEYDAEFIVLNPVDWEDIELTKDSEGRYIIAQPQSLATPRLWGLPVVATNSQGQGQFLVANGTLAAQIWDRQQANVQLSTEDTDNFRKNMVTIRAEERLALTVYRPTALIKGVFSV